MLRRPIRVRTLAAATMLGLAASAVVWAPQSAVADTASDYEAAKAQLDKLAAQSDQLVDQYNESQARLSQLKKDVSAAEGRLAEKQKQFDEQSARFHKQAAAVYKYGANTSAESFLAVFTMADASQVPTATRYLSQVQNETRDAMSAFGAARDDLQAERDALSAKQKEQQELVGSLDQKRKEIESSVSQQQQITDKYKTELDAERAAAAEQARRAAAEAQRQAQQQATTRGPGGTPARARGGSSASSGGGGGDYSGPPSGGAGAAVAYAQAQLGKPYCWGGAGPSCFDCSGLTMMAWRAGGKSLPHSSGSQASMFPSVSSPAAGDLAWRPGHIALVVGGGSVINAPHTGDVVKYAGTGGYSKFVRP
ncbi:MAG: C40 family peptidase [Acidimicrobiia bacterium]|nr:C40 family peptidase [Acidimicrobiia bacterium]